MSNVLVHIYKKKKKNFILKQKLMFCGMEGSFLITSRYSPISSQASQERT